MAFPASLGGPEHDPLTLLLRDFSPLVLTYVRLVAMAVDIEI